MGVGHVVSVIRRAVIFHRILGNRIRDFRAAGIFRKVRKRPGPVVLFGHGHGINFGAVSQKADRDLARTLAVLIVIVIPGLASADTHGRRRVGIGNQITLCRIPGDFGRIAIRCCFLDGIDILYASCVLIQLGKGIFPAVLIAERDRLPGGGSVLQQRHFHGLRTDSVLIVSVVPGFYNGQAGLPRRVGVGHVVSVIRRAVIFHRILGNRIRDFRAAGIFRKVRKRPGPVVLFGHGHGINFGAVGQKADHDLVRTLAILIIGIVPGLAAGHIHRRRRMGIGDPVSLRRVSGDPGCVACRHRFVNGIHILSARRILIQPGKGIFPAVLLAERDRLPSGGSVLHQRDFHAVRADPVLIVSVVPCFHNGQAGLPRRVGVGHVVSVIRRAVIFHRILGNRIRDFRAAGIFRKVRKRPGPVVLFGHGHGINFGAVSQKADRDLARTLAVLIVIVIPGLASADTHGRRRVGIGNQITLCRIPGDFGRIAIRCCFLDGIDILYASCVLIQLGKGIFPAVLIAERDRLPGGGSVLQQRHIYGIRTDPVLIVFIVPGFHNGQAGLTGCVGIGHIISVIGRSVLLHRILSDRVTDCGAVIIFREAGKVPCPVILSGHGQGLHHIAVGVEPDCDALRSLAVLVIRIVPGLAASDIDGRRRMRIGDLEPFCRAAGNLGRVAVRLVLSDRILVQCTVGILIQPGKGPFPVVFFTEGQGFSRFFFIFQK